MERNIHAYDEDVKWQLEEPGALMSAKNYRDKKALPLVERLKDVVKNAILGGSIQQRIKKSCYPKMKNWKNSRKNYSRTSTKWYSQRKLWRGIFTLMMKILNGSWQSRGH